MLRDTNTKQQRGINLDSLTHTHRPKDAALSSVLLKLNLNQAC